MWLAERVAQGIPRDYIKACNGRDRQCSWRRQSHLALSPQDRKEGQEEKGQRTFAAGFQGSLPRAVVFVSDGGLSHRYRNGLSPIGYTRSLTLGAATPSPLILLFNTEHFYKKDNDLVNCLNKRRSVELYSLSRCLQFLNYLNLSWSCQSIWPSSRIWLYLLNTPRACINLLT